jgi:hypothetical protein
MELAEARKRRRPTSRVAKPYAGFVSCYMHHELPKRFSGLNRLNICRFASQLLTFMSRKAAAVYDAVISSRLEKEPDAGEA